MLLFPISYNIPQYSPFYQNSCFTIWRASCVVGLRLLWPAACETRAQPSSVWSTNTAHNNTGGTWHWRRKMARISRHIELHGIRHTFDRQEHKALLQPNVWIDRTYISTSVKYAYTENSHVQTDVIWDLFWYFYSTLFPLSSFRVACGWCYKAIRHFECCGVWFVYSWEFLVLTNFHSCFYSSLKTREMFSISYEYLAWLSNGGLLLFLPTLLSISPCWSCTKRALMAAM